MNHNMYHNPIVKDNIKKLASYGYEIITPATGMLANGDLGDGRMPDEEELLQYIIKGLYASALLDDEAADHPAAFGVGVRSGVG